MKHPDDLPALAVISARFGVDPLLIQGAGGNTSVKDGDVMWIKASGTLLADALDKDIFVPCDLPAMRDSIRARQARADRPQEFSLQDGGLRPSIETSLHAVFPHRIVVHVHSVYTIVQAIQSDPVAAIAGRLDRFNWGIVPYAKPGAALAASVMDVVANGADVVVLGNHGLIVGADTVEDAADLLLAVHNALACDPVSTPVADIGELPNGWVAGPESLSMIACDPLRSAMATNGSLYPDHVIFCGIGAQMVDGPLPSGDTPPFVLLKGKGAAMRADATAGAWALAECLGDVLLRVPDNAELTYLTLDENAELLDWDAEKYRQALNA